jgi:hypothetical protein
VALALSACGGKATCEWGSESWAAAECGKTTCFKVAHAYAEQEEQAKVCDPKASRQCTEFVPGGIGCGTWVNAENTSAIDLRAAASSRYDAMSCWGDETPTSCLHEEWSYCSAEGRCTSETDFYGQACRVNGQTYVTGTRDILGLFGCGSCVCDNGALTCTGNEACEGVCPPDSAPGTQCDGCFDGRCLVAEPACLPRCETTCDVGTCVDGLCRYLCD